MKKVTLLTSKRSFPFIKIKKERPPFYLYFGGLDFFSSVCHQACNINCDLLFKIVFLCI